MILSILIPTKNRYQCLISCINNILPYIDDSIEIIIQDNSDSNELFVERFTYPSQVKYFYTKESIPISDNTELAIKNSTGDYLLFIGDDDFVTPYITDVMQYVIDKKIKCLSYDAGYYWWNSVSFVKEDRYHQKKLLTLPNIENVCVKRLDAKKNLVTCLKRGAIDYHGLPRLYHGIVKRDILENIKLKVGSYLCASCPDMAFSVSLSIEIDFFHHINFPITIFGASRNSGGGMTASNTHYMRLEDAYFLRDETIKNWDSYIPRVWSERTIYPQTTSEVLKAFNQYNSYPINYLAYYAALIVYEPQLIYEVKEILHQLSFIKKIKLLCYIIKKIIGKILKHIKEIFPSNTVVVIPKVGDDSVHLELKEKKFKLNEG